jgi:hypothetical protein
MRVGSGVNDRHIRGLANGSLQHAGAGHECDAMARVTGASTGLLDEHGIPASGPAAPHWLRRGPAPLCSGPRRDRSPRATLSCSNRDVL